MHGFRLKNNIFSKGDNCLTVNDPFGKAHGRRGGKQGAEVGADETEFGR